MKRKILSILLSLAMVFTMIPMTAGVAFATGGTIESIGDVVDTNPKIIKADDGDCTEWKNGKGPASVSFGTEKMYIYDDDATHICFYYEQVTLSAETGNYVYSDVDPDTGYPRTVTFIMDDGVLKSVEVEGYGWDCDGKYPFDDSIYTGYWVDETKGYSVSLNPSLMDIDSHCDFAGYLRHGSDIIAEVGIEYGNIDDIIFRVGSTTAEGPEGTGNIDGNPWTLTVPAEVFGGLSTDPGVELSLVKQTVNPYPGDIIQKQDFTAVKSAEDTWTLTVDNSVPLKDGEAYAYIAIPGEAAGEVFEFFLLVSLYMGKSSGGFLNTNGIEEYLSAPLPSATSTDGVFEITGLDEYGGLSALLVAKITADDRVDSAYIPRKSLLLAVGGTSVSSEDTEVNNQMAGPNDPLASVKVGSVTTEYYDFKEALAAAIEITGSELKLLANVYDVDMSAMSFEPNEIIKEDGSPADVTIDLNGHQYVSLGSFEVVGGSSLTLKDTTDKGTMTCLAAMVTQFLVAVAEDSTFTLEGGTLDGMGSETTGVAVISGGTFTMEGGTIKNNRLISENGAGVLVKGGEFTMNGGTVCDNITETGFGAGVAIDEGGEFVMNGGTICNNSTATMGGGVFVFNGNFEMKGGKISENRASCGGGVYVGTNTYMDKFTMTGGTICSNAAIGGECGVGGGVFVMNGSTFVATGGIITQNVAEDAGAGVYIAKEEDQYTCLAAGTPITLADGSRTAIENLKAGDEVRVFDHETGELATAKLFDLWKFPEKKNGAFTLHFTDGIDVTAVGGHCFFEKDANKYVDINVKNAEGYIGHKFYNADDDSWKTLESVDFITEPVDTYIIVSEKSFNTLANGMLSNVDGLYTVLCNIFDLDENLKVDAEKKAEDIKEYGLWDYDSEHFKYVTEETYKALNLQYLGIAIEKGLLTQEELEAFAAETVNLNTDLVRSEMLEESEPTQSKAPKKTPVKNLLSKILSLFVDVAYAETWGEEPGAYLGGDIKIYDNALANIDYLYELTEELYGYYSGDELSGSIKELADDIFATDFMSDPAPVLKLAFEKEAVIRDFFEEVSAGDPYEGCYDSAVPMFVKSNLFTWSEEPKITLDTDTNVYKPKDGMYVGIQMGTDDDLSVAVTGDFAINTTPSTLKYFHADSDAQYVAVSGTNLALCDIPADNYKVVIEYSENGTVKAQVDNADVDFAVSGTSVTLKVTPDSGYELVALTVVGADGAVIPVSSNKFTMPEGAVTVSAEFEAATTPEPEPVHYGGNTHVETAAERHDRIVEIAETQLAKTVIKAKSKLTKLNGKKAVKINWSVTKGDYALLDFDGFDIFRSTEKSSGYGKTPFFSITKTSYTNNKELKKGKTYYYKVRAYKIVDGEKVYTGWSTKAWRTVK